MTGRHMQAVDWEAHPASAILGETSHGKVAPFCLPLCEPVQLQACGVHSKAMHFTAGAPATMLSAMSEFSSVCSLSGP